MVFSYNWLQSFFKKKLPNPKKLAEILTMHFMEVEEVEKEGKDWVLDIDILPSRGGDCFSHLGVARECQALTNSKLKIQDSKLVEAQELKTKDLIKIEIKNKEDCPRYTARIITDIRVGPSPKWLQQRLKICGLQPINNVVDIANYIMLETGQPLHAFDFGKIEGEIPNFPGRQKADSPEGCFPISKKNPNSLLGRQAGKFQIKKIIIRRAKKEEKITTLDEKKYTLDEKIIVIADTKDPVAIAGTKGGKKAEIDRNTKIILLESANFNSHLISRASRQLNLKTDASWRFEHNLDPNLTEMAINRAAYLIQKIANGKVARGLVDIYPKKTLAKRVSLDLNYIKSLLGVEVSKKQILTILKSLGFKILDSNFKVQNSNFRAERGNKVLRAAGSNFRAERGNKVLRAAGSYILVEIPTFRQDILLQEDLIEEIGRTYGFQKIKPILPLAFLIPSKRNEDIFWQDFTKDILKEAGFSEVYNYSFLGEKEKRIFGFKKELEELKNPVSIELEYLRPSLIPILLRNVAENLKYFKEIKIFELGKVFLKSKITKEKRMLTGVMAACSFYEAKGIIDSFLNKLGISNIWYDEYEPSYEEGKWPIWHPKKCAEIKVGLNELGFLGEISPRILLELKILQKVIAFDFDFEKLQKECSEEHEYQPISRYPAAVRDVAVLVPGFTKVEEVLNRINSAGGKLIRDVDLFDFYEGKEVPQGKRNLAFHIIFQAEDRTLTTREIDEIQQKIIKNLEEDPEWKVRR